MTTKRKAIIVPSVVIRRRRKYILYGIAPCGVYDSIMLHNGLGKIIATNERVFDQLERYFNTLDDGFIEVEQDYNLIREDKLLKEIMHSNKDKKGRLLNAINIYDDCLLNIAHPMDLKLKSIMYELADHLTFDPNLITFLGMKNLDRNGLHEVVSQWFDITAEHIIVHDIGTSIGTFLDIIARIKSMVRAFDTISSNETHS